jgi:hypothetical protein
MITWYHGEQSGMYYSSGFVNDVCMYEISQSRLTRLTVVTCGIGDDADRAIGPFSGTGAVIYHQAVAACEQHFAIWLAGLAS